MKRLIIATMLVSTGAMAQSAYEIPSIEQMVNQPTVSILPVAPISRTGPTTVWQAGNYTFIDEPQGQTTVFQDKQFTYITPPKGPQTVCQTIGKFVYCN